MVLLACGNPSAAPTTLPEVVPTPPLLLAPAENTPVPVPTAAPLKTPAATESIVPTSSPTAPPEATPVPVPDPITLTLLTPVDGSGVELETTRVMGRTSAARVAVNGLPVEVAPDGSFQRDMALQQGVNLLEVVASDPSGRSRSQQLVVYVISPVAALPFSLLYPNDAITVDEPSIPVVGVTMPDAVVGVNGVPVLLNERGVFSTTVPLQEGENLIEIVATDILQVRYQMVAVFYTP